MLRQTYTHRHWLRIQNLWRIIGWKLLVCFCLGWLVACAGSSSQTAATPESSLSCRVIQHVMGETCVPENPQRIVALSGFAVDTLFSLDMQPVGAITNVAALWADKMQEVEPLGLDHQVDLEKVLALHPDLILASQWNAEAIYDQLSAIAPTVLDDAILGEWKKSFALHANALDKAQQAEELMTQYHQKVQDFQFQMGESIQQLKISLARILPEGISIYLKNSFAGSILDDIGFARPRAQDKGVLGKMPFVIVLSKEKIQEADGDVIFTWTFGATPAIAQSARSALEQIQSDPLWLQLSAVQQGKVYEVSDYWHVASTPTQAIMVIDDLLNHLRHE
jgi:iron complex transport system substrate-binding protein